MGRVKLTETALRDAHQSLLATRMRTRDMLPIAEMMDQVGFFSIEMWGGATFDTCIRFERRPLGNVCAKPPCLDSASCADRLADCTAESTRRVRLSSRGRRDSGRLRAMALVSSGFLAVDARKNPQGLAAMRRAHRDLMAVAAVPGYTKINPHQPSPCASASRPRNSSGNAVRPSDCNRRQRVRWVRRPMWQRRNRRARIT